MPTTPRARSTGPAFLIGWIAGLSILGAAVLLISSGADASSSGGPATWVSVLKLVLGVLLLLVSLKQWRGRPHGDAEPELPKWMAAIEEGQQLLASGDADGAMRKFKDASDNGGGAVAKEFVDQVKLGAATVRRYFAPVADFVDRRYDLMFEVQVKAAFQLAQLVIPGMQARGRGWIQTKFPTPWLRKTSSVALVAASFSSRLSWMR